MKIETDPAKLQPEEEIAAVANTIETLEFVAARTPVRISRAAERNGAPRPSRAPSGAEQGVRFRIGDRVRGEGVAVAQIGGYVYVRVRQETLLLAED